MAVWGLTRVRLAAAASSLLVAVVAAGCDSKQAISVASAHETPVPVAAPAPESVPSRPSSLDGLAPPLRRAFEAQPGFTQLAAAKDGEWRDRFHEGAQSIAAF